MTPKHADSLPGIRIAPAIGIWAAAVALAPGAGLKLALAAPPLAAAGIWYLVTWPERWLVVFFGAALLTPPLPFAAGNSGAHLAPLVAAAGMLAGAFRLREWRKCNGWLPLLFIAFTALLAATSGLALLYSGSAVAAGSLARVLLFATGVWVFFYTRAAPFTPGWNPLKLTCALFAMAVAGALFACVDFYFHLPAPAGFGPQFVWLEAGVFRRAQGLFYEASTLGNFCAFFLAMIPAAFLARPADRPAPMAALALGSVPIVAALILSYSRASLVNVGVMMAVFLVLRGRGFGMKGLLTAGIALAGTGIAGVLLFPTFFALYWTRLGVAFEYFAVSPDRVLSGRLASWAAIGDFLSAKPWLALFGIGYKTLPYTSYLPGGVVADNTYLSLLAETGIVGLTLFLLLNAAILRTAFRAAASENGRAAFFGSWIFSFWCGELVQMISGDLITYWRVLPLYFWALAMAAREADV
jgi:hypothetical protein